MEPSLSGSTVAQVSPLSPVSLVSPASPDASLKYPSIGHSIQLTDKEVEWCIRIGKERNQKNLEAKTRNMRYSKRTDEEVSISGVAGELAFCKMHGLKIEIDDTTCRNSKNDTFDARFPELGVSVDVKAPHVAHGLWVLASKATYGHLPDMYALLIISKDLRTATFKGMELASRAVDPSRMQHIRGRWFYVTPFESLECWNAWEPRMKTFKNGEKVEPSSTQQETQNIIPSRKRDREETVFLDDEEEAKRNCNVERSADIQSEPVSVPC